jgi:hypothetical protein
MHALARGHAAMRDCRKVTIHYDLCRAGLDESAATAQYTPFPPAPAPAGIARAEPVVFVWQRTKS